MGVTPDEYDASFFRRFADVAGWVCAGLVTLMLAVQLLMLAVQLWRVFQ